MPKKWLVLSTLLGLACFPDCSHNPQRDKVYYLESGQKYMEQGQPREAMIQFRNALQVDPHFVEAYRRLGKACYELQQYTDAAAALTLAVELESKSLQTHALLGEVYLSLHDYQSAEKEAESSSKGIPPTLRRFNYRLRHWLATAKKKVPWHRLKRLPS